MKNITIITKYESPVCNSCNKYGFFCYTPYGGEYSTCPLCQDADYFNSDSSDKLNVLLEDEYIEDIRQEYSYCKRCRVIFDTGCKHAENGCTSSVYNGHLIDMWLNKNTNDVHHGMPQFDDEDDWFKNGNMITILRWNCPNSGLHCTNGYYPKLSHPNYYPLCSTLNTK